MAKKRKLGNQAGRTHSDHARPRKRSGPPPPSKPTQKRKQHKQVQHELPTIPFEPHDRILLIGEGDLSFAASLVTHHGCTSVTATVLEKNLEELAAKYPHVEANIAAFTAEAPAAADEKEDPSGTIGSQASDEDEENFSDAGWSDEDEDEDEDDDDAAAKKAKAKPPPPPDRNNRIAYAVDATKPLPSTLTKPPYNTIVFNFPHVGGLSTDVNRQVRHNQSLLVSFFNALSTARTLAPGGAIVVTLFEGEPYTLWNVKDLARHAGLEVEKSFRFQAGVYPGYRHARTCGVIGGAAAGGGSSSNNKDDGDDDDGEKAERSVKDDERKKGGWKGEERKSRTFVFRRKGEVPRVKSKKRKKVSGGSDNESD